MVSDKKYENCISLGWFCGMASSMRKVGIRDFRGPFDWNISNFKNVLRCIEEDFADFMNVEFLEKTQGRSKCFTNTKYGFIYPHDIVNSFEEEINDICLKYKERAEKFMRASRETTMFLHMVWDFEEVDYITNNVDYILSVVKKNNPENDICFFLPEHYPDLPEVFISYRLPVRRWVGNKYVGGNYMLMDEKVKTYVMSLLDEEQIERNIRFNKQRNGRDDKADAILYLSRCYSTIIKEKVMELPGFKGAASLYVWGAGVRGIPFAECLSNSGMKVKAIIDSDSERYGEQISGVPVISLDEVDDGSLVYISPVCEDACKNIIEQIRISNKNISFYTCEDLDVEESMIDMVEMYKFYEARNE